MANEAINKEMEQLRNDMAGLRSDLSSLVETVRDLSQEKGQAAYQRAKARVRDTGDYVQEELSDMHESIGRQVEERPMTSLLVTFGAGFLVGMLLDRRR